MRYLAIIDVLNVLDGGHVDNTLPVAPPSVGMPGMPTNPVAPGGGVWGGAPSTPDNTLPGVPPVVGAPGMPTNPIAPGGMPPQVAGGPPLLPDNTLPPGDGGVYVLAFVPHVGWRYVKVDLGLRPDNELPETPEPK